MRRASLRISMCVVVLFAFNSVSMAVIYLHDGLSHTIDDDTYQNEDVWVNMMANPATYVELVDGGIVRDLQGWSNATITMSGGSARNLYAHGIGNHALQIGGSVVTLSGGSVSGDIRAYENAILYLVGSDFYVNGIPLQYEDRLTDFSKTGTITGILADGSVLNNPFAIYNVGGFAGTADIVIVPEPTTLLLLGLGGVLIRRKK